jgi:hypothetical protein
MGRLWRFAAVAHPYFNINYPEIHAAFKKRFKELGGWTPELSKKVGWDE